jgi:hypothetical protein
LAKCKVASIFGVSTVGINMALKREFGDIQKRCPYNIHTHT